jgi:type IV secretory pathway VirB10-like protein
MTTVEDGEHVAPPQMLPRDPRPWVDTLRGWPFLALGGIGVAVLASVTVLPAVWSGNETAPVREPAPTQINTPRSRNELPSDYTQVQRPEPQVVEQPTAPAPTPQDQPQQQQVIIQQQSGGSGRPAGPTRAQILKAARMSNLVTVKPVRAEAQQASAQAGGGSSGKLYNQHRLTPGYECQVDAGTNIPAMTEQRLTSESPGTVSAVATRDVWSADKTCLAIPRGTRFVGRYQTAVTEGQVRIGIMWTGLTRPPPRRDTIELADTVAGDPDGTAGVTGEVNNHFWKKLAFVAAATLLDIGKTAVTAGGEGGIGAAVAGIFANRAASPLDEWASRQLDIPSVIEVKPREISIVLAQHLPMNEFRAKR